MLNRKYIRNNKPLLNNEYPHTVNRLNNLVATPMPTTVNVDTIHHTASELEHRELTPDSTINTIELECKFLENTLANIATLKKSEKLLKIRLNALKKCLKELKNVRTLVTDSRLVLTSLQDDTIINNVEEQEHTANSNTGLGELTITEISVPETEKNSKTSNIDDFANE